MGVLSSCVQCTKFFTVKFFRFNFFFFYFLFFCEFKVDTAGWLERSGREKGPSSLSIIQSRKNLMRAHIVALVLDGEEVCPQL